MVLPRPARRYPRARGGEAVPPPRSGPTGLPGALPSRVRRPHRARATRTSCRSSTAARTTGAATSRCRSRRGGSLAERLAAGPMRPAQALEILAGVAAALDAAHAAGVLHRDVTPGNILLDPDGPWLADFGIARRIDATVLTGEGELIGTAGYMAPEVIGGRAGHPGRRPLRAGRGGVPGAHRAAASSRPRASRACCTRTRTARRRGRPRSAPPCPAASTTPWRAVSRRTRASAPRPAPRWSPRSPAASGSTPTPPRGR